MFLHRTQEQPFLKFVVVFRGCQLQTLKSVSLTTHFSEGLIVGAQSYSAVFSLALPLLQARLERIYGIWDQKDTVFQHFVSFIRKNSRGMLILNIPLCTPTVLKRPVTADELLMPGAPYVRKTFTVCLWYFSLFLCVACIR